MRKVLHIIGVLIPAFFLLGGVPVTEIHLSGKTMGTTYHITLVAGAHFNPEKLKHHIARRLDDINRSMSTYLPDSEITRFNHLQHIGEKFCPSEDFFSVMSGGERMFRITEGAWDGTVGPLVELWGFGRTSRKPAIPSGEEIEKALSEVGFKKIDIIADGCFIKRQPNVTVDLGSIAKGYGVDAVSEIIRNFGIDNFLVEIGGEIFASGVRKDGKRWRVGINTPSKKAAPDSVYRVVKLQDMAFATSGNYRNYFEINGQIFSHILDPRTGRPIDNGLVSVSIVAENCTVADGLATGIMVLGWKKGLALVNRLDDVECLIVVQKADGTLVDYPSKGFEGSRGQGFE